MATIQIKLGTLDMSEWAEAFGSQLPSRLNEQSIARRHGVYLADVPLLDKNVIRLKGSVIGSTIDEARTYLQQLATALNVLGQQKFYYWSDKFWVATKATWNWEPVPGSPGLVHRWQAELHCPDPYLYEDETESDEQDPAGSDLPFALTNAGDADAYPRITFTADKGAAITACQLQNLTTGYTFTYAGTVAIGTALVIDPNDATLGATVKNNGTEDLTNVSGEWPVLLVAGANSMKFVGSACSLKTEWRNRWPM